MNFTRLRNNQVLSLLLRSSLVRLINKWRRMDYKIDDGPDKKKGVAHRRGAIADFADKNRGREELMQEREGRKQLMVEVPPVPTIEKTLVEKRHAPRIKMDSCRNQNLETEFDVFKKIRASARKPRVKRKQFFFIEKAKVRNDFCIKYKPKSWTFRPFCRKSGVMKRFVRTRQSFL